MSSSISTGRHHLPDDPAAHVGTYRQRHAASRNVFTAVAQYFSSLAQAALSWRTDVVFDPEENYVFWWAAVVVCSVTYNIWSVILRIAFTEMRQHDFPLVAFGLTDFVADVFYFVDFLFQFRLGYLEEGIVVKDTRKLADHYIHTRRREFLYDVISIAPVYHVITGIDLIGGYISYSPFRLLRLMKVHRLRSFLHTWEMKTSSPNLHRAFKLLLYLATVIHWIGCFYYIVSQYEGLGTTPWVLPEDKEDDNSTFGRKYLLSIYWSTMTLTTIGDTESPSTNLEYVFTGVTFLIGVFMFATVVGNVGDVITNMNHARVEFQQKMDHIKFFMGHHNIPHDVQNRVKRWAEYSWNRTQAMDDQSTLAILPFRFRAEIAKYIYLESLQKVAIFEDCERGLLCELAVRLRSQIYSPGDFICRRGEIGREMYIISHGKVEVLVHDRVTVVATLQEGNSFGEISLLKLDDYGGSNRRTADVRSVGYSELLVLSDKDLTQALTEYPAARRALEKQARARIKKNLAEQKLRIGLDPNIEYKAAPIGDESGLINKEREVSELRHIIQELRGFDSFSCKQNMKHLNMKCKRLKQKLTSSRSQIEKLQEENRQLRVRLGDSNLTNIGFAVTQEHKVTNGHHTTSHHKPRYHHHTNHRHHNGDVAASTTSCSSDDEQTSCAHRLTRNHTCNTIRDARVSSSVRHANNDNTSTPSDRGANTMLHHGTVVKPCDTNISIHHADISHKNPRSHTQSTHHAAASATDMSDVYREETRPVVLPAILLNDQLMVASRTIQFTYRYTTHCSSSEKYSSIKRARTYMTDISDLSDSYSESST